MLAMNERDAELTSALLDGELDRQGEERAVTALLAAGRDGLDRFGRYRLIGDVMRGESAVLASSMAERVRQALADEPIVLAPRRRQAPRWLRPVAGVAVAASVAAAAVIVAPPLLHQMDKPSQPMRLAADPAQPGLRPTLVAVGETGGRAVQFDAAAPTARWQALDQRLEERLNRLMVEHQEFGGRTGINGPVPHIGFVSYEAR
jgi:sigma-E factor negative regulatory protein RseA